MPWQDKSQLRFAARATLLLAGTLALWWFVLRAPLLDWVQFSSALALHSIPGIHAPTGVTAEPSGGWSLQLPAPGTVYRSARVVVGGPVVTMYTVNLPLYWAVLFAGPWSWRLWRSFLVGSGLLLLAPPFSLLAYGAHLLLLHVYPHAPLAVYLPISFADYLGTGVLPYILPPLLALALQSDLRALVLWGEQPVREPAAPEPGRKLRRSRQHL
jgi:hypothetical protein